MKVRSLLTLLVPFLLSMGLIFYYFSHAEFSYSDFLEAWQRADKKWILLAAVAHLINHALRSYRWRLLLQSQHIFLPLYQVFLCEMTGFFWNGFGFKLGEGVRCALVKNMTQVPGDKVIATVVVERLTDIFFFFYLFLFIIVFSFSAIREVLSEMWNKSLVGASEAMRHIPYGLLLCVLAAFFLLLFFKSNTLALLRKKMHTFFSDLFHSIQLTRHVRMVPFWTATAATCFFYFLLEFVSLFAFEDTYKVFSDHGIAPILCIFIALNISHLTPLPNGAGTYHILIPFILTHFGVPAIIATAYALITHGIQTFNALIPGGLCYGISFFVTQKREPKARAIA